MKKVCAALMMLLSLLLTSQAHAGSHRLGGGINYWVPVDDIDVHDIDDNAGSYAISYQYWPTILGFQFDLELLPDKYGETTFAPQAFLVFGRSIYAGAGIGVE